MRKIIDKIASWLVSFNIEAYLHILVTMIISMLIARVCLLTGADRVLAGYFAAFVAFVLGFIKEAYDNKTEGVFEGRDVFANFVGALLFFITWI